MAALACAIIIMPAAGAALLSSSAFSQQEVGGKNKLKQIIFVDKNTGHLFTDARLSLEIHCPQHPQSAIDSKWYCKEGKHTIKYKVDYMLFETSSTKS